VITWSACWRARPGSDVVCMADTDTSRLSKVIDICEWWRVTHTHTHVYLTQI